MKLTPLDIHHKEFGRSLRGYNEAEVDAFLDQVADELERLFKENIDLSERNEAGEEKVKGYQDMERTLHNTMVSAQKSAEDIVAKARQEADLTIKDSEVKAKEIIHNALQQKQKTQSDPPRGSYAHAVGDPAARGRQGHHGRDRQRDDRRCRGHIRAGICPAHVCRCGRVTVVERAGADGRRRSCARV
jgi:cell division initiation protein